MTVASTNSKAGPYAGAGTTGPFAVDFRFLEDSHLQVIRTSTSGVATTLTLTTDYTVTGAGGTSGEVTLVAALAVGETLTVLRSVPATQETDYVQNDAFPAESHERALDKLTMIAQQQGEVLSRAITVPAGENGVPSLPSAADRAGKAFSFDGLGNPVAIAPSSGSALDVLIQLALSTGSALVGWIQSGAGAVSRLVRDKLRDTVSVKDFGAVGNGIADDTAAIQAALNSGALNVYLPRGSYRITSTLTLTPRVSMHGDGGLASELIGYGCDILSFVSFNNEGETSCYRDFGLVGGSGANFTAILCSATGGVKHGLHFLRLRIQNINAGIALESNLHCSIDKCGFTAINQPVRLGNVSTFTKVRDNIMVCQGGDTWGSAGLKRAIYVQGGVNCEATKISGNFLFGFARGIQLDTVTDVVINDNGIDACTEYGIIFQAVQHNFDIKDNFFELMGAGAVACIYGLPLGSGEYLSKINIEGNSFTEIGGATVATTGIQMNTTTDTYQWHVSIVRNVFNSMRTHDIRLNLPGETFVRENRCMSTDPTNSIWIGGVAKAPVVIEDNWFQKAVFNDVAADLTNGKLRVRNNAVSNVWAPADVFNQTWTPANASVDPVTITSLSQAYYTRTAGRLYTISIDIQFSVQAGTAIALVTLPANPAFAYQGACGYTTSGTQALMWRANAAGTVQFYDAVGNGLTNANLSGKRITATITFTS